MSKRLFYDKIEVMKQEPSHKMRALSGGEIARLQKALKNSAEAFSCSETDSIISETYELIAEKKYYEAELNLKFARSKYPNSGNVAFCLANLYFSLNRFSEAEKHYYQTIKLDPRNHQAYINLADIYTQIGKLKAAEKCLEKSLVVKQTAEAFIRLANIYLYLDLYLDAEKYYLTAIQLDETAIEAHLNLALVYEEQGALTRAEETYKLSLGIMPDNPALLCGMANLLYLHKKYDDALALLEKVKMIKLEHYDTHIILAKVFLTLNRLDKAEQALRVAEELGSSNFRTYRWYGNLYTAKGQFILAERAFKTSLTLSGNNAEVKKDFAAMLNLCGRPKEAEKVLKG